MFLETRGADLCKTTQFLSYYALPYVPDPRSHPSFNELFNERHVRELEDRLGNFLGSALRSSKPPVLLSLVKEKGYVSILQNIYGRAVFLHLLTIGFFH